MAQRERTRAETASDVVKSMLPFKCPSCQGGLELRWRDGLPRCGSCDHLVGGRDGTLDWVSDSARKAERSFYDAEYTGAPETETPVVAELGLGGKTVESLAPLWHSETDRRARKLWSLVGDLCGKTVLLLGNGDSEAELYFLTREPERLIVSDLSAEGMRAIRSQYNFGARAHVVSFAAIDALDLPLFDGSVDVVYGCSLVHHLPDVERFLSEVVRVLRPGGRAVFFDNAYAPVWHLLKQTVLKPLMLYTHRRQPISPEDLRFTMSGGFRIEELDRQVLAAGARPWFVREDLFYYLWIRGVYRLFPSRLRHLGQHPGIGRALVRLDGWSARHFNFVRRNLIDLYWGLEKPLDG